MAWARARARARARVRARVWARVRAGARVRVKVRTFGVRALEPASTCSANHIYTSIHRDISVRCSPWHVAVAVPACSPS